jgi:hypothetical protein
MPRYAQIDLVTNKCVAVSLLSGEVEADHLKLLEDTDVVNPGDTWDSIDSVWIPSPPVLPVTPGPSNEEEITELKQQLAQTSADLAALQEMILFP